MALPRLSGKLTFELGLDFPGLPASFERSPAAPAVHFLTTLKWFGDHYSSAAAAQLRTSSPTQRQHMANNVTTAPVSLPAGFTCSPRQVLNRWEQTLYNLCEQYFYLGQQPSAQHPVLSQVRLPNAITISQTYIDKVQVNAMSFDILITDSTGWPKLVFEADGHYHKDAAQQKRDKLKDAIATLAGLTVFRVTVDGQMTHLEIVRAEASIEGFDSSLEYPGAGPEDDYVQYSKTFFPDQNRLIEAEDLELLLIKANWQFPAGWKFVTGHVPP